MNLTEIRQRHPSDKLNGYSSWHWQPTISFGSEAGSNLCSRACVEQNHVRPRGIFHDGPTQSSQSQFAFQIGDSGGDPNYRSDVVDYIPIFVVGKAKGEFSKLCVPLNFLKYRVPHVTTTTYIEYVAETMDFELWLSDVGRSRD